MEKTKVLFVKATDAARMIGSGKSKVYEMVAAGELPSCRIGGMIRIPVAALEKLAAEAMESSEAR